MRRILLLLILQAGIFGMLSGSHMNQAPLPAHSAAAPGAQPAACDQGPANPPNAARESLEQVAADWGMFCEGTATWRLADVLQPVP